MEELEKHLFLRNFIKEELYLITERGLPATPTIDQSKRNKPEAAKAAEAIGVPAVGVLVILKQRLGDLEPSQKGLLVKIMGAVKVDLMQETVIHEPDYKVNPGVVTSFLKVISFGVELPQCPSKYQLAKKGDQLFLASDSVAALEQAIALKGKLWKAMQEMFSLGQA